MGFVVHMQARKEERTGTGKQAAQELGVLGVAMEEQWGRRLGQENVARVGGGISEKRGCAGWGSGEGLLPVLHCWASAGRP